MDSRSGIDHPGSADELRFDGRVAVVTGAGGGLGEAYARAIAARGGRVVVNDIGAAADGAVVDVSLAQRVAESIVAEGGEAVACSASVTTEAGGLEIVETAVKHFGQVDIVVNNAGILTLQPLEETDTANVLKHLEVHLLGAFNVTQAAWPHMVESNYGRVVMATSSAIFGIPIHIGYAAAKAGQLGLVNSLAQVAPDSDIKINALAPAAVTRMWPDVAEEADGEGSDLRAVFAFEPVVATLLYLVHESCALQARVLGSGSGSVDSVFLGITEGYFSDSLTPEDVRDNAARIVDTRGWTLPANHEVHLEKLRREA